MILTTKAKYAVIAVAELIASVDKNPVALSEIAKNQKISLSFLEQIFSCLKKAEIVKAVKGPGGGYLIAKSNVNVADIILAIKEPVKMTRCSGNEGCNGKSGKCITHKIWRGLEKNIFDYLESISLQEIIKQHKL